MVNQAEKVRFTVWLGLCWRGVFGAMLRLAVPVRAMRVMRGRARMRLSAGGGGAVLCGSRSALFGCPLTRLSVSGQRGVRKRKRRKA